MKKIFLLLISNCDKPKKLFIIASEEEVDIKQFKIEKELYKNAYLTDVGYILYTGIGEVKATYSLTKFLTLYKNKISEIYNIGTCGATPNNKFGDEVVCSSFLDGDYQFPNKIKLPNEIRQKNNSGYMCHTTDMFYTKKHDSAKIVFDMESAAFAEVLLNFDMLDKFHAIKIVSDIVGQDNSQEHWFIDAKVLKNKLTNRVKEISKL